MEYTSPSMIKCWSCCWGILQCDTLVPTFCVESGWVNNVYMLHGRAHFWQSCGGTYEGFLSGDFPGPWPAWLRVCCCEVVKLRQKFWLLHGLLWALQFARQVSTSSWLSNARPVPGASTSCLEAPRVSGYLLLQTNILILQILESSMRKTFEQHQFESLGNFSATWGTPRSPVACGGAALFRSFLRPEK